MKTGNHDLWNALHRQRLALRELPHLRVRLEWAKGPCNEAGNRAATKLAAQAINNGASTGAQVPTTNWEAHIRAPEFVPRRTAFRKTKTNREAEMYDEWVVAQHVYVPKKGSLDDPKNWRSICVLRPFWNGSNLHLSGKDTEMVGEQLTRITMWIPLMERVPRRSLVGHRKP